MTKGTLGRKGFISLPLQLTALLPRGLIINRLLLTGYYREKSEQELKQGRNIEAEANAEAKEGDAYWFLTHNLFSLLCYRT